MLRVGKGCEVNIGNGTCFFFGFFLVDLKKKTETKEFNKEKQLSMWVFHSTFRVSWENFVGAEEEKHSHVHLW